MECRLKGCWFKSPQCFTFSSFISTLKDVGSYPGLKQTKPFTNKKKKPPLSPFTITVSQGKAIIYSLFKKFNLLKYYHPIPLLLPFICARSMPQPRKKVSTSKDYLSLLVYLYLLVYGLRPGDKLNSNIKTLKFEIGVLQQLGTKWKVSVFFTSTPSDHTVLWSFKK